MVFLAIPRDLIDIVLRSPVITMLPLEREGKKMQVRVLSIGSDCMRYTKNEFEFQGQFASSKRNSYSVIQGIRIENFTILLQ
ncbi:MAG TPA: hypothetical protein VK462_10050 [Nitrososphaeraceae archaeon]|nr:hypothetical protein [Nitrososphaeraceae archaeon]